jgi:hypothetical protein
MEVWTFIHKETNEIIRADIRAGDIDSGEEYFFTTLIYSPLWFVSTEEEAKIAYKEYVNSVYTTSYKRPATDRININDYEIKKFTLDGTQKIFDEFYKMIFKE